VAEDNDVRVVAGEQLFRRRAAQFVAMAHVNGDAVDRLREVGTERRIPGRVRVAEDRLDGGDLRQHAQDFPAADVAGVEDEVHAVERLEALGAHEAVCVGDEADDARAGHGIGRS
jgi:hypothetical protein